MEEARAAHRELVERRPCAGRRFSVGSEGEEIGGDGGDQLRTFGPVTDVSDQGGELGGYAGNPRPTPGIVLELVQYGED